MGAVALGVPAVVASDGVDIDMSPDELVGGVADGLVVIGGMVDEGEELVAGA